MSSNPPYTPGTLWEILMGSNPSLNISEKLGLLTANPTYEILTPQELSIWTEYGLEKLRAAFGHVVNHVKSYGQSVEHYERYCWRHLNIGNEANVNTFTNDWMEHNIHYALADGAEVLSIALGQKVQLIQLQQHGNDYKDQDIGRWFKPD
jgi:hypothetical protein